MLGIKKQQHYSTWHHGTTLGNAQYVATTTPIYTFAGEVSGSLRHAFETACSTDAWHLSPYCKEKPFGMLTAPQTPTDEGVDKMDHT